MQRSVIQLAGKTLVVSLPYDWCKENHVLKGDKLEIECTDNGVLVNKHNQTTRSQVNIDISSMKSNEAWTELRIAYVSGFDEIRVICGKNEIFDTRQNKNTSCVCFLDKIAQHFQGMELMQQNKNSFLLKSVSMPKEEELSTAFNRAVNIARAMYSEDRPNIEEMLVYDEQLNRITDFCLRVLSLMQPSKKNTMMMEKTRLLEEIGDCAKEAMKTKDLAFFKTSSVIATHCLNAVQNQEENCKILNEVITSESLDKKVRSLLINMICCHKCICYANNRVS